MYIVEPFEVAVEDVTVTGDIALVAMVPDCRRYTVEPPPSVHTRYVALDEPGPT